MMVCRVEGAGRLFPTKDDGWELRKINNNVSNKKINKKMKNKK